MKREKTLINVYECQGKDNGCLKNAIILIYVSIVY